MKKVLKFIGITTLVVFAAIYLCFLFILPKAVDLNKYKPIVQDIAKEQANLSVDFSNIKLITTPFLGAGVKIDNLWIKLPDNSLLFSAASIKTRVSLPSILVLTAKISCLEIDHPFVNLEIANDNVDYKVVKLIEDILNTQKENKLGIVEEQSSEGFRFNPEWIRIKVPSVKLNNYKVLITDAKKEHYLDLHGELLKAGYFNGKTAKIQTYAELFSDDNKNITANININTFLPKAEPTLDAEDDPAERIDIPFVNPVEMYRNYDLKTNLDTKLKIRNKKNGITSFGYLNIDDVTMKVSQLVLPKSYIHLKTFAHTVDTDINIYTAPEQNFAITGKLNYSKHPWTDLNIKTGEIKFNDVLTLTKAFLDSLQIPNELGQFNAYGSLVSDCYIKTNFKKLKSSGYLKIKNGGLAVRNLSRVLSDANINLILADNTLDIENSSLFVYKSKVNIAGKIDKQSVADIKINTDKLPLPILFNAFAPKELRNAYNFQSGDATLHIDISGKLKDVIANARFGLENLNLSDRQNNFRLLNKNLSGNFVCNSENKSLEGNINNENFVLNLPTTQSNLKLPKLEIAITDKNIKIKDSSLLLNEKSKIKFFGNIQNYEKLENIEFLAQGNTDTDDLIKLIGRQYKPFIHSAGSIPVKVSVNGNKNKQTILAQAIGDKYNYITPIDFTELADKTTSLQTVIDLKPKRIKIKKTGLFIRTQSVDEKGNEIINLDTVAEIDGTIAGNRINLIKVSLPKILSGKIHVFPKSSLVCDKAHLFVYGEMSNPIIRGLINIRDIKIPELLMSVDNAALDFRRHDLDFGAKNITLNGSDITANGTLDLNPGSIVNITAFVVNSKYINLEKLLKVVELAMKYVPENNEMQQQASNSNQDIPVAIRNGFIDMKRIITGNIQVDNTTARMSLLRNTMSLRQLYTNIFKGNVRGDIDIDLISTMVNVDLRGENINVEKAMLDAVGMKDMLSGTAKFDAILSINGAATTPQDQLKGINGDINFIVENGQFGPFGKIENLIIAENIRESQFFQTALGGVINSLTSIDTTHFTELIGHLNLEQGTCHIDPITSLGNVLSLHIFGDFDLIENRADMKVRARMASLISKVLGPLNAINPINLMNSAASLNVVTAKAFSLFCEVVPTEELNNLPNFANKYVDNGAAKFQLVVRGDVAKPLTLVKSFKWLTSQAQFNQVEEYVNSLPELEEGSTATNIEEAIAEAKAIEAEKQTIKYKIKHVFDKNK